MNRVVYGWAIIGLLGGCAGAASEADLSASNSLTSVEESNGVRRWRFDVGFMGDNGYSAIEAANVPAMIDEMSRERLAFSVHVGDIKGQAPDQPCTDASYQSIFETLNRSAHPLIYTPGDNEWVDCQAAGPNVFAVDRLAALRRLFFPGTGSDPVFSLGQKRFRLESQGNNPAYAKFRENNRWSYGPVQFVTLNVPDSDFLNVTQCFEYVNSVCVRSGIDNSEWAERSPANVAWLNAAFDKAEELGMRGVVVILQANFIGGFLPTRYDPRSPRYQAVLDALKVRTKAFSGQVLLVHGDTHIFRVDQPYASTRDPDTIPGNPLTLPVLVSSKHMGNFTRLEVFGSTNATKEGVAMPRWVRVSIDTHNPDLFSIQPGNSTRGNERQRITGSDQRKPSISGDKRVK